MLAIGRGGADIRALNWPWTTYLGYAAGLDLTRRDMQEQAEAACQPGDMAKGFYGLAPLGAIAPAAGDRPP